MKYGPKLTEKEKNQQIKKEALISAGLYIAFLSGGIFTGYGIAEKGAPETYTYVLGLPMWFFLKLHRGIRAFFHRYDLCRKEVLQEF